MPTADEHLVSIFKTDDPARVPLATMALEAEGIEYSVRQAGKVDSLRWMMSQSPTNRPEVVEILVASDVATRARDLVMDLERQAPAASSTDPSAIADGAEPPGIFLDETATGIAIGAITEAQLQELTTHLAEDEGDGAQEYVIDAEALDALDAGHADEQLIAMLRRALGDRERIVIRWTVR